VGTHWGPIAVNQSARTPKHSGPWCSQCQGLGWFWANFVERVPGRRAKLAKRWDPKAGHYITKRVECDTMRLRSGRLKQTCECENGQEYMQRKFGPCGG
jgi:hypothetical protein